MPIHQKSVTPFQSNTGSGWPHEKGGSVTVKSDMSRHPTGPAHDPLKKALWGGLNVPPPKGHGLGRAKFHPKGVNYNPAGEFGKVSRTGAGRGVYSYGSAPNRKGGNAVGNPPNRRGGNALRH